MTDNSPTVRYDGSDNPDIDKNLSKRYLRIAENWGIFAIFLFLGTFVIDLNGVDQLFVWIARVVFAVGAAVAFTFASRFEKDVCAAQKATIQSDAVARRTNDSDSETT